MKRFLAVIICVILGICYSVGQSRFGIEFKISKFKTQNTGHLISIPPYTEITKEEDAISYGFSGGVVYKFDERNLIKLHFGRHHNGSIFTVVNFSDVIGSYETYYRIDKPYSYFQIAPSYAYRILNKKLVIPAEVGLNINKQIKEWNAAVGGVDEYNFDFELTTGIHYRIIDKFLVGIQGIYTKSIGEYQKWYVYGNFKPQQFGVEFSAIYEL